MSRIPVVGDCWTCKVTCKVQAELSYSRLRRRVVSVESGMVGHRNAYGRYGEVLRVSVEAFTSAHDFTEPAKLHSAGPTRPRAESVALRAMKRLNAESPEDVELRAELAVSRPATRADCVGGLRPCPFLGCRYHLYLDVNPETGSVKLNFPDTELHEMAETCTLDVADRQGMTLARVGSLMNLTRERIRQLESQALARLALEVA